MVGASRSLSWSFFNPELEVSAPSARQAAVSVFHTIFSIINQLSNKFVNNIAYPEVFKELSSVFEKLNSSTEGEFESAPYFSAHPEHVELMRTIQATSAKAVQSRDCLKWRVPKRKIEKMLTPAFDVDYQLKKSANTTNNDAVKLKVLQTSQT